MWDNLQQHWCVFLKSALASEETNRTGRERLNKTEQQQITDSRLALQRWWKKAIVDSKGSLAQCVLQSTNYLFDQNYLKTSVTFSKIHTLETLQKCVTAQTNDTSAAMTKQNCKNSNSKINHRTSILSVFIQRKHDQSLVLIGSTTTVLLVKSSSCTSLLTIK